MANPFSTASNQHPAVRQANSFAQPQKESSPFASALQGRGPAAQGAPQPPPMSAPPPMGPPTPPPYPMVPQPRPMTPQATDPLLPALMALFGGR